MTMLPTANGKVILVGEHAVVHGASALALAWPDALRVTALRPRRRTIRLQVPAWGLDTDKAPAGSPLAEAIGLLAASVPGGFEATAHATIPVGAGLGGSAALSVTLARCAAAANGATPEAHEVQILAHALEHCFHGSPSGIDDTAAVYGGALWFSRHGTEPPPPRVSCAQLTESAWSLGLSPLRLVVGYAGEKRHTKDLVAGVQRRLASEPIATARTFTDIGRLAERAALALAYGRLGEVGPILDENQALLQSLGVSTPLLDTMITVARQAGARGAKLTGAGGGGCMIAYAPGAEEDVEAALAARGWQAWIIEAGGRGSWLDGTRDVE